MSWPGTTVPASLTVPAMACSPRTVLVRSPALKNAVSQAPPTGFFHEPATIFATLSASPTLFWAYAADALNPTSMAIKKILLLNPIDSSEGSLSQPAYKQGEGSAN